MSFFLIHATKKIMNMEEYIDIESAKERFMSNEALYKKFLYEFPERSLYVDLKDALAEEDVQKSFEVAHKMKGVSESISLILLGRIVSDIVEILRKGNMPGPHLLEELDEVYKESMEKIHYIKENELTLF